MLSLLGALLGVGADGRWRPGIGDPTLVGWLTVVAYLVAGLLCLRAARLARAAEHKFARDKPTRASEERALSRLWTLAMVAMFALGVNKQLDLQSWLTQVGRDMARDGGWYAQRRMVQVTFILAVMLVGAVGTAGLAWSLRSVFSRAMGTVVGLGVIVSFVIIRAASFHHFDILIGLRFWGVRGNWLLELGGISIVAVATYRAARSYRLSSAGS